MSDQFVSAESLRHRAAMLRGAAARIDRVQMTSLIALAGSDTWLGPRPAHCALDLRVMARRLAEAADELQVTARLLERRAAELTPIAASPIAASPIAASPIAASTSSTGAHWFRGDAR